MNHKPTKIVVILGPTASGKSDLAVKIAEWINQKSNQEKIGGFTGAEIISADSRQIYKGLDIGTGKITKEEMHSINHHCLDIVDPQKRFTVTEWKAAAEQAIDGIVAQSKLPIICGGTGFYITTLVDDLEFPSIKMSLEDQEKFQKKYEQKTVEELIVELQKLDPVRADNMIKTGDSKNKRRVIRSILVAQELGAMPVLHLNRESKLREKYDPIFIGITTPDELLKERIKTRLTKRIGDGMIKEAEKLHREGLSSERMDELGLEYRYLALYIQGKLTLEELIDTLSIKIWQYARRQKTWFKKDERIKWFELSDTTKIEDEIQNFMAK